ncbi:MAG: hypothetical protein H7839_05985 [Magnetococcus sp. YQC-5]
MTTTAVRTMKASIPIPKAKTIEVMAETDEIVRVDRARFSSAVDLRKAIQDGIESGPGIPADQVFEELKARYAD